MLVRLPDVSVDLFFASVEQVDEAVRWLWVVVGDTEGALPLSASDADTTEELIRTYGAQRRAAEVQAGAARDRGDAAFTLELDFPEQAAQDIEHLVRLLEGVDELVSDQDLAPLAPPEVRDFRRQILTDVATQLRAG